MSEPRINGGMRTIEVAQAIAGMSQRAFEIAIETTLYAVSIDPDHFLGAMATCFDLDDLGVHDDKLVDLFDNVCCGCHVNLRTRIRARNLGLVGEEGFWAPDLSVEHYLKQVRKTLPRFAKDMPLVTLPRQKIASLLTALEQQKKGTPLITARQKALPALPPTPEQIAESAAITDAADVCIGVGSAGTLASEAANVLPPADLGPRYQSRMWMPSHERDLAKAFGPVRGTVEEAERDLEPYRGEVAMVQYGLGLPADDTPFAPKYAHGAQWESMTPPEGFVLS